MTLQEVPEWQGHLVVGSGIMGTICLSTLLFLIPLPRPRGSQALGEQVKAGRIAQCQTVGPGAPFLARHSLHPLFLGPLLSTGGYSFTTPSPERQIRFQV